MSKITIYPPRVIIVGIPGLRGPRGLEGPPGSGGGSGGGGVSWTRRSSGIVTAAGSINFDATSYNYLEMDPTLGNQTVVMPPLAGVQGLSFRIKRVAAGNNLVTIQGTSGQTIEGLANMILYDRRECLELTAINTTYWEIT